MHTNHAHRSRYPNLPITATDFRKQVSALNSALKARYGSVFHHAEFAKRASPDKRRDNHNLLCEFQNHDYAAQCDLHDKLRLKELCDVNMRGVVVLDLYVYTFSGFNDWELADNVYALFQDGIFLCLGTCHQMEEKLNAERN